MNKSGLCSITFRDLTPTQVIEIVKKAGLDAIEWGSDVHVKPGDNENAKKVRNLTIENGLEVSSYGSYYRVGIENEYSFEDVLETAVNLGAEDIRVWAGRKGSSDADEDYRKGVVEDAIRIAKLASNRGININFEYHKKTLTDTAESAKRFMEEIDQENVYLYWQPAIDISVQNRLNNIDTIKEWISNIHVFQWKVIERLDLYSGLDEWKEYVSKLNKSTNNLENRFFLLEFVKDDSIEQFYKDAKALKEIIKGKDVS
ncbi:sugar phosphate isomerase/epimerase [Schnuerera sp. xch1]|uniref:sugar phosphate isomerase/epimerase family protein n=1 Tax=Schnuerera sp. xch1 TaxID=2874283 RepID=UPI001CBD303E|nr:TIM barrel protein [Schnuerera sp. xch1]MBZ2174061.1 sugar phosphate isomerase/epimerase [Schnuerera sp. xch1]